MKFSTLGSLILFGTLGGMSGIAFADEPAAPQPTDAAPAAPSAETIKKARDAGLKTEVRRGVTVFCWEDADIGSRFKTKKCVNENRLAQVLEQRQAARDQLTRGGGNYGSTK